MGHRVTHAARHLSEEAVYARMQGEQRAWRRKLWEIIYQALSAPRKAEEIARTVGVSTSTVHRVIAAYNREGVAALETPGKGGRHHEYLTLEQERAFLQPFVARAGKGEIATIAEIHHAFEERVGHPVDDSTIYRLLSRQGWKKPSAGAKASSSPARLACEPAAHEDTVPVQKRRKQQFSSRSASQKRSSRSYPSDLTEQEWALLEPLIPPAKEGGHPRTTDMREVLNALFYVDRTGCQWRALPHDFPAWSTVWSYFRTWRNDGTWKRMHTTLREKTRVSMGREPTPSAAIIDSQSVKTTQKGGDRGYDGGKKVKGRKRHILVDTVGLILQVLVHEANIQDQEGGKHLLKPLKGFFPRLKLIWADSAYKKGGFIAWVKETFGWEVEVVEHPWSGQRGVWTPKDAVIDQEQIRPSGFHVLKWRWIVERTFAWLSTWRRLAKDYEVLPSSEEAWIYLAMIRLMVRRLGKPSETAREKARSA